MKESGALGGGLPLDPPLCLFCGRTKNSWVFAGLVPDIQFQFHISDNRFPRKSRYVEIILLHIKG